MSEPSPSDDQLRALVSGFDALRRRLVDEGGGPSAQLVVELAATVVPHAEHSGLTLVETGRQPRTVAASGELADQVDALQYATGEGPCLEAVSADDFTWAEDLTGSEQWPLFGPRCAAETGVRSMFSLRLRLTDGAWGALNFYATGPGAFDHDDLALGAFLAPFASLALQSKVDQEHSLHLEQALQSSRQIGAATGILMARQMVTQEEAFGLLSRASQHLNRKLRDVAAEVTETGELPARS